MIIPYIASVMRDALFEQTPVMMKRIRLRYRLYHMGSDLEYRFTLYPKRCDRWCDAWIRSCARGNYEAVTFIIGNTYQLDSASLFMPGNSITSALANEFAEAETGLHTAALMELGLIYFVITFIVLLRFLSLCD